MEYFYQEYSELLQEFNSLPKLNKSKSNKSQSIFNIAGYPHYENVASNILAFYFNPNNEHGLGNLLLHSLLSLINPEIIYLNNVKVYREVYTKKRGRIDLLITTDDLIIGIENKILHELYNNLDDYSSSINEWAEKDNKKESIKIVLSIRKLNCGSGFVNVTYKDYCPRIKDNLGRYTTTSSQKWILYLIDFINTIEELEGKDMQIDKNDEFFINNNDKLTQLTLSRNDFTGKLKYQIERLKREMNRPEKCFSQWIYKDMQQTHSSLALAHEYELSGHHIALDITISPSGWYLSLMSRNPDAGIHLKNLFSDGGLFSKEEKKSMTPHDNGYQYTLREYSLTTDLEIIKDSLYYWFKLLADDRHYGSDN